MEIEFTDTCKLYFEANMEADMWVNLQFVPVSLGDKTHNLLWKTSPKFRIVLTVIFFVLSEVLDNVGRIAYLLELTIHEKLKFSTIFSHTYF